MSTRRGKETHIGVVGKLRPQAYLFNQSGGHFRVLTSAHVFPTCLLLSQITQPCKTTCAFGVTILSLCNNIGSGLYCLCFLCIAN